MNEKTEDKQILSHSGNKILKQCFQPETYLVFKEAPYCSQTFMADCSRYIYIELAHIYLYVEHTVCSAVRNQMIKLSAPLKLRLSHFAVVIVFAESQTRDHNPSSFPQTWRTSDSQPCSCWSSEDVRGSIIIHFGQFEHLNHPELLVVVVIILF